MEANFWHDKWERGAIAFHNDDVNPLLLAHWSALGIKPGGRVCVPLCGKTHDIGWLLASGYEVVAAELSRIAIEELFDNLGVTAQKQLIDGRSGAQLELWSAEGLLVYVGDIFELTAEQLGPVDAVYDRAANVALPEDMRPKYCELIGDITITAPQLLVCFDYDQSRLPGPPFSVPADEVDRHYGSRYQIDLLASEALEGGLKGKVEANEQVWRLWPHAG